MTKYAVTFGTQYNHDDCPHPVCAKIDGHSYLTVEADDELAARYRVMDLIGRHWAFIYEFDEDFLRQIEEFKLWDVTPYVTVKIVT